MRLRLMIVVLGVSIGLGAKWVEKWVRSRRRATPVKTEPVEPAKKEAVKKEAVKKEAVKKEPVKKGGL